MSLMFRVKGSKGLLVREGRALTSAEKETLACGAEVRVVETRSTVLGDARCRLDSGGWGSLKLLEAAEEAPPEEARSSSARSSSARSSSARSSSARVPEGEGACAEAAHGEAQVDDCVAFEGLAVSGGWDGAVRVANGDGGVAVLRHDQNAWCYSVAAFRDGGGGLALFSGHTGGMTGDSSANLRLWRPAGRGAKRAWRAASLGGHTRGVHAVCGDRGLACSASSDLLQVWAVGDEAKCVASVKTPGAGGVNVNALLLDGHTRLLAGSKHPALKLWDLETLACGRAEDGMGPVEALARVDAEVFVVAAHTGAYLWDARARGAVARLSEASHVCWGAAVARAGTICYGGAGSDLVFYDLAKRAVLEKKDVGFVVKCVGFDDGVCACGSQDGRLRAWWGP